MFSVVLMAHSYLRWLVLFVLGLRILRGAQGAVAGKDYGGLDRRLSGATLGLVHLQVLLGIVLYATSPRVATGLADMGAAMGDTALRFVTVEHPTTMILGAVAAQAAFSLTKRSQVDATQHLISTIGFGIALGLILLGIPWAAQGLAG